LALSYPEVSVFYIGKDEAMNACDKTAVICLSGGMDSTSLLMHLLVRGYNVFGLSFDYGQKHRLELERLAQNLIYLRQNSLEVVHETVDISILGRLYHSALTDNAWQIPEGHYEEATMKATVVPNRNAIFSAIAYVYALSIANRLQTEVALALGVHSGDHAIYPDCRPAFYEAIFHAFQIGNWDAERVSLYLPYLHSDKYDILQDAQSAIQELRLDFRTIFRNTNTSYEPDPDGRASGKTGADVERILAFHKLGVPDPIDYIAPWEEVVAHAQALENAAKPQG
jgi:7-cyano-7-deazaguanine synthase